MTAELVVLSAPRSGSNAFIKMLNCHPDVACHPEVFHRKKVFLSPLFEDHAPADVVRKFGDLQHRDAGPQVFYRELQAATLSAWPGKPKWFGCKLFFYQNKKAREYLCGRDDVAKIILERENKLHQFASVKIGHLTGAYTIETQKKKGISARKAVFDMAEFQEYVRVQQNIFRRFAKESAGRILHISYRQLMSQDLAPVAEFLQLDPAVSLTLESRRQNPPSLRDKFENFDEMLAHLEGTSYADWVEES